MFLALSTCVIGSSFGASTKGSRRHQTSTAGPQVIWISQPVLPGQTVLVRGAHLDSVQTAQTVTSGEMLPISQQTSTNLALVLPADLPAGPVAVTLNGVLTLNVNVPEPYFSQEYTDRANGNQRLIRIFGRCLAMGSTTPTLSLLTTNGSLPLTATSTSMYEIDAPAPTGLPAGSYTVQISTNAGGVVSTTSTAVALDSSTPNVSSTAFTGAHNTGADVSAALRAALQQVSAQGGGALTLSAGTYQVSGEIDIPANVALIGVSSAKTIIRFVDGATPPENLLTLADGSCLANLAVTAIDTGYASTLQAAVYITGSHCEVAACNIQGKNCAIQFNAASDAWIHDTVFENGNSGWSKLVAVSNLVFERNQVEGGDATSTAGLVYSDEPNGMCSQNLVFQSNSIHSFQGNNREGLTTDSNGGLIYGPIAQSKGTQVVIRRGAGTQDPAWIGAGLFIVSGTGMGQYRQVVSISGDKIGIDRPWDIPLDTTSYGTVVPIIRRVLVLGNSFADCGSAVQFYGTSIEATVDGNQSQRVTSFSNVGKLYGIGLQPSWYIQWLNNTFSGQSYAISSGKRVTVTTMLSSVSAPPTTIRPVPILVAGVIMRGNNLMDGAYINLGTTVSTSTPSLDGAVVEGNTVTGAAIGVNLLGLTNNLFIGINSFINCLVQIQYPGS